VPRSSRASGPACERGRAHAAPVPGGGPAGPAVAQRDGQRRGVLRRAVRAAASGLAQQGVLAPVLGPHDEGRGQRAAVCRLVVRAVPLHAQREPAHAAGRRAHTLQAHQGALRQALRGGVEPLQLLQQGRGGDGLFRQGVGRIRAAADDDGDVRLHAPGRTHRRAVLRRLFGGARRDDDRRHGIQPVLREGAAALRRAGCRGEADLRPPRAGRQVPARQPVQGDLRARGRAVGPPRCAGARLRPPDVEHIWLWTDAIEQYYTDVGKRMPRPRFDVFKD